MRRCLILKKARFWRAFCYASYRVGICSIGDLEADIIQMRVLDKLRDVGKAFEIPAHEFRIGQVLQTLRIGRNNEPPLPRSVFPPAETDHIAMGRHHECKTFAVGLFVTLLWWPAIENTYLRLKVTLK